VSKKLRSQADAEKSTEDEKILAALTQHLPLTVTGLFIFLNAVYALRVAHGETTVAVSLVREQPLQSLVAWIPKALGETYQATTQNGLRSAVAAGLMVSAGWLAHARKSQRVDRVVATVVGSIGSALGLLNMRWWVLVALSGAWAFAVWNTSRRGRHVAKKTFRYAASAMAILTAVLLIWKADEPWTQEERISVTDETGRLSDTTFCDGWVLGEQANGRWLIVLLDKPRSIVTVETEAIWKRRPFSSPELTRLKDGVERGTVTLSPLTTEERAASCPATLIDRERVDKLTRNAPSTTSTSSIVVAPAST
jgi:hypothetical protein